jgi:hypothetical protein
MFKPVDEPEPSVLNAPLPLDFLAVLFLAAVVAFSVGLLALLATSAIGAGALGTGGGAGGGGGGAGLGGDPPIHNTADNNPKLTTVILLC